MAEGPTWQGKGKRYRLEGLKGHILGKVAKEKGTWWGMANKANGQSVIMGPYTIKAAAQTAVELALVVSS